MTDSPSAVDTQEGTAAPRGVQSRRHGTTGEGGDDDRGTTTIRDVVVAKIVGIAAREVRGVADLGGTTESALGGVVGRLRGDEHTTVGVGVEVGEREAAVDVAMKVEYPARIHEVAASVRDNIISRVETMTGLDVVEVNVSVVDLVFEGDEGDGESQPQRVS